MPPLITTSENPFSCVTNDCWSIDLAQQFNASVNTISKWKARGYFEDASSRPYYIQEALTDIENALINRCKSIFKFGKYKLKLLFGIGYK
jgi:hypothetical protein